MTTVENETAAIKNCAAIVLAAGQSSRLGEPKQLLKYQGRTLLQHAIDAVKQSSAGLVIVVLGSNADAISHLIDHAEIHIVKNDDWQSGIASSIRCGISALPGISVPADSVILMVCDQPFVTSDLLNSLIREQAETNKPIVASRYGGTVGTPALFHNQLFPQLMDLKGDAGAKKIMMQNSDLVATVSFPQGRIDIDTMDDYEALSK